MPLEENTGLKERYVIQRLIKKGGMGAVYLAMDRNFLKRFCAVKALDASLITQEGLELFEMEANVLANLSHPGIPKIYDKFSEGPNYYIVMEYVEGEDLESKWKANQRRPLEEEAVVRWAVHTCSILEYLHNQSPAPIVFRDLKPSNIMVDLFDLVKLVDFGIVRFFKPLEAKKSDTIILGTAGYAPPELYGEASQGQTDPRSDIYGLGATIHHLVTSRDPRDFPRSAFPPVTKLNPKLSPALEIVVAKALEEDRDRRFQTAQEMRSALEDLKTGRKLWTGPSLEITTQQVSLRAAMVARDAFIPSAKRDLERSITIGENGKVLGDMYGSKIKLGDHSLVMGHILAGDGLTIGNLCDIEGMIYSGKTLSFGHSLAHGLYADTVDMQDTCYMKGGITSRVGFRLWPSSEVWGLLRSLGSVDVGDNALVGGALVGGSLQVRKDASLRLAVARAGIYLADGVRFDEVRSGGDVVLGNQCIGHTLVCRGELKMGAECKVERAIAEGNVVIGNSCQLSMVSGKGVALGSGCQVGWVRAEESATLDEGVSVDFLEAGGPIQLENGVKVKSWSILSRRGGISWAGEVLLHGVKATPQNLFALVEGDEIEAWEDRHVGKAGALLTTLMDHSLYHTIQVMAGLKLSLRR